MKLWICTHTHRFGRDIYLAFSQTAPVDVQFIEEYGIDFEPDKEEYLEIEPYGQLNTIPTFE